MATVKCKYCGKQFDREKEPFVQIPTGQTFRYAHGECYLKQVNTGLVKEKYIIWDPAKSTTCFWCHKAIFSNQDDVIPMPQLPGKFVHKTCNETHPVDDKEELLLYLIQLYNLKDDYILPKFMLQLSDYEKNYQFTYSGMLKSLKYWYEVKKKPVNASYGLGIIPHIYKEARDYYYKLWQAQEQNKGKNIFEFVPKDIEVKIPVPKRQIIKRKLFTFLDEEEINGE